MKIKKHKHNVKKLKTYILRKRLTLMLRKNKQNKDINIKKTNKTHIDVKKHTKKH